MHAPSSHMAAAQPKHVLTKFSSCRSKLGDSLLSTMDWRLGSPYAQEGSLSSPPGACHWHPIILYHSVPESQAANQRLFASSVATRVYCTLSLRHYPLLQFTTPKPVLLHSGRLSVLGPYHCNVVASVVFRNCRPRICICPFFFAARVTLHVKCDSEEEEHGVSSFSP